MASLSELMQAAILTQRAEAESSRSGRIASFLNKALQGYHEGRELARQEKEKKLDLIIKRLDIQKKQEALQQSATENRISLNLYKQMGMIDLDANEADAARPAALDAIAHKEPPRENTTGGRLSSFYVGDREFAALPKVPGIEWKEIKKEKAREEKDSMTRNTRIREQAIDAARREKFNTMVELVGPDEAAKFASVQPTEDEVQKFIPEMTAYFEGKNEEGTKIRENRQARNLLVNKSIKEIDEEIIALTKKTKDWIPFDENPERLAKLTQRKNRLIEGGGLQELRAQIAEDIEDLKKDPKINHERLVELTKQLLQLSSVGR